MKDAVNILNGSTVLESDANRDIEAGTEQDGFGGEKPAIFHHSNERRVIDIQLEVAAARADLFVIKDALPKQGEYYRHMRAERLVLAYRRKGFVRETIIKANPSRNEIEESPFALDVVLNVNGYNPIENHKGVTEQPGSPTHNQTLNRMMEHGRGRRSRKGGLRRGEKYRCEPPRP